MDDHRKRVRVSTPEGIFVLDSSGHYIPEAERDEPLKYRGIIIVAGAIICWALFFGIAYCAWRIFEALAS